MGVIIWKNYGIAQNCGLVCAYKKKIDDEEKKSKYYKIFNKIYKKIYYLIEKFFVFLKGS